MSTLTDTLVLPDWIGDETGAHVQHDRREVSWRIHHPEGITVHRCQLVWAWFTVREERMWKGEPLHFFGERRVTENGGRDYFTDLARKSMAGEVLPPIMRYGFDRLWTAIHQRGKDGQGALSQADLHQREATWWRQKAELMDLYGSGLLEFVPTPPTPVGEREFKVETAAPHGFHSGYESVSARALFNDEHVGWMTTGGDVIPLTYPRDSP